MEKKTVLSSKKHKQLKDELDEMTTIGRKLLADKLDQYREEVRDEDSAAFSEVLEEKEAMEMRIAELTELLANCVVSDKCEVKGAVGLGCTVHVKVNRVERVYSIVSAMESDPQNGLISEQSPIGKALMGKKKGETAEVVTPGGSEKLKVLKIK